MRAFSGASLAGAAILVLGSFGTSGCARIAEIQANRTFNSANTAYNAQDYALAAELYEETIAKNPGLGYAYFFLGNSYDNMYRPARKGEPENDELLVKAEQNYITGADILLAQEEDPRALEYAKLTLDYLRALYTDKTMEPGKAEEVVQRMIRLDPSELTYYFALARIYEDAGVYDEAEYILQAARDARPTDPDVYITLAGFYNRMGDFDKTIEALEQRAEREPDNPEAFQSIAPYYWDNAQRNTMLSDEEKMGNVERGLDAVDRALKLRPDYIDAIVYRGLLLRVQALLETDPETQQNLLKEAESLSERAESLRQRRASGVAPVAPADPPAQE